MASEIQLSERCSGEHARLVERIRSGDRGAEEELVERFSRGLSLMLRRLARDPALAEDVYQETFRTVLAKARAGEIREGERLAGFLRGTAKNLLLAEWRKGARLEPDGDAAPAVRVDVAPQLRQVLRREEAGLVRKLLREMRFERDRQILVRFYLSEDTKHEICADLDVEVVRFKGVLHRARERLRELWERAEKRQRFAEGPG